jgi:tripartite-type tricarboxylate transporter receptor subunit TctC
MSFKSLMGALLFSFLTSVSYAQNSINVELVWPFGQGGTHDLLTKMMAEEANKLQSKYNFSVTYKAGAGGAIAVNHALSSNSPVLISHSSSFWLRTKLYKEGRYNAEDFVPLAYFCVNNPLVLISSKHKSLEDLMKVNRPTIGSIPGSITYFAALNIGKNSTLDPNIISYRTARLTSVDVLGKHIDSGIDFYAEVENNNLINILGITGNRSINNVRTFKDQGISGLEVITNNNFVIVPKNAFNSEEVKFLRNIFDRAARSPAVSKQCESYHAESANTSKLNSNLDREFSKEAEFWSNLVTSSGVREQ